MVFFRKQRDQAIEAARDAVSGQVAEIGAMQKLASTVKALLTFYLLLLIGAAIGFSIFENKPIGDAIWWAIVTSTSVGYGDFFPVTLGGRVIGAGLMLTALLVVIPILTAQFSAKLIVDSDAFSHAEQEELKIRMRKMDRQLDLIMHHLGVDCPDDLKAECTEQV